MGGLDAKNGHGLAKWVQAPTLPGLYWGEDQRSKPEHSSAKVDQNRTDPGCDHSTPAKVVVWMEEEPTFGALYG